MKKLLLLACTGLLCAGSMLAEATEALVYTYDYTNWPSWDPTPYSLSSEASPYSWTVTDTDGNSSYNWSTDTGFVAVSGGQLTSTTDASSIASSEIGQTMTLFNFGGDVGKVLCLNGGSSGLQTYLNEKYGTNFGGTYTTTDADGESVTINVQSITSGSQSGYLNFFWSYPSTGDHRVAQDGSSKWIRAKIELNVFSTSSSTTGVFGNGIDFFSDGGNAYSGTSVDVTSSAFYDDNNVWDPGCWMTYTTDGYVTTGGTYNVGVRIKFQSNVLTNYAIFIRKIKLYYVTGDSSDYLTTATTTTDENYSYEFTTTANGQTTGITSTVVDDAACYTVNGQDVTFEAGAQIYSVSGALVGVAQPGETMTLSKGFYVARVGNQGVKFAIQ